MKNILTILFAVFFIQGCNGPTQTTIPNEPAKPVEPAPTPEPEPTPVPVPAPVPVNPLCPTSDIEMAMSAIGPGGEVTFTFRKGCAFTPADPMKKLKLIDVSQVNCAACVQNHPIFLKLAKDVGAVCEPMTMYIDRDRAMVLKHVEDDGGSSVEIGLDTGRLHSKALKNRYTPTTYVINEQGAVVYSYVGVLPATQISKIKAICK
jgi:hypothetical protein